MKPHQDEAQSGNEWTSSDIVEPIAIVGIAARFAKDALSVEDLWEILLQSRSTWSPVPEERFNSAAFYHPDPEHGGTHHTQGGHFLTEDPAHFDSSFFNMTKNEVLTLDPQQRLVMENVYHALENAGIPLARATGSNTSVYVSGFNHDYLGILNSDGETTVKYKPTGVSNSIISNRVSWFFDFKGPSMTIDTACSSSLVALHLAVQSLRSRETTMSVVSGVNILENPLETIGFSHHGLLGAQGRSFSFDARAEGYARGEGVGSVILKPLKEAVRDGDVIRAVLRETGVNQDGRTPGITVPSGEAQENLIRQVYKRAGLDMRKTRFVEAHGTGTRTGDPIEAKALSKAFDCERDGPLHIGSIKSTLGHVEGGSGVAGLIKVIMILESGIIPATYDLETRNPEILADEWNIDFPSKSIPWPTTGPRRASLNSFGIGGTNAHCVLDDAYHYLNERGICAAHSTSPVARPYKTPNLDYLSREKLEEYKDTIPFLDTDDNYDSDDTASVLDFTETPATQSRDTTPLIKPVQLPEGPHELPQLFLITAYDEDGVKRSAASFSHYLKQKKLKFKRNEDLLRDLSFTLSARRSTFPWKSFVMASTANELQWNLSEGNFTKPVRAEVPPDICFVFTGQGAQYSGMGKSLLAYRVFRNSLKDASDYLQRLGSPWSLLDEHTAIEMQSRVDNPEIAHPLSTALQIALLELLASWGIFPTRVIGHSSGEVAAAYCAGKLTRESAWKVAYYRGQVSSKQFLSKGGMMAVGLDAAQTDFYVQSIRQKHQGELTIACYNSPMNSTVSGDIDLIDELKIMLDSEGIFARKLKVQNAYHSSHMKAVSYEYLYSMGCLEHGESFVSPHRVRMFSTLTGEEVIHKHLSGQYWVENMISPVRFTDGLAIMNDSLKENAGHGPNSSYLLELGPHSTLQSAIKDTLSSEISQGKMKYQSLLSRVDPTLNPLLSTIGFLAASGYRVDIHNINISSSKFLDTSAKLLVDLPAYPFKHTEKILYESRLSKNTRFRKFPRHDLFGAPVADWNEEAPRWRQFVRLEENPWLKDHVVTGNYIYPGVGYIVMAIEASRQLAGQKAISGFQLRQVSIHRALIVPETKQGIEVSISMTTESTSEVRLWRRFQISSYNETSEIWTEHCTGLISVENESPSDSSGSDGESEANLQEWRHGFEASKKVCDHPINFTDTYDNLLKAGLEFGVLFRNLHDVNVTKLRQGQMTGTVTIPDIAEHMPYGYAHSHLIHPATMDSMIHMMIAAVMDFTGSSSLDKIRLPTFIRDMWVSADLNCVPGYDFEGHASVEALAAEKFEGQIRVFDSVSKAARIYMNDIELTPLETEIPDSFERQLCTNIVWNPDLNFLLSETACAHSKIGLKNRDQDLCWTKRLQLVTMLFVTDALQELHDLNLATLQPHLRRFYDWMVYVHDNLTKNEIPHLSLAELEACLHDTSLRRTIVEEVRTQNAEGALTVRMGQNISAIMRQKLSALDLMFGEDNLMENVYKDSIDLYDLPQHLESCLSLIRHQSSQLRILEVGGGTGSLTAKVLSALSPSCDASSESIASYTFTDISSGFFEKAKVRFDSWKDIMSFKVFNLEEDPTLQGFDLSDYDLIIGGNVIHATKDLNETLTKLRSLLQPGGKLIMQEGIRQDFLWYPLSFGFLPGWWLGDEPIRKWCPYIPVSDWDSLLMKAGFSGVDIEYPSCQSEDLSWQSIMVSTALCAEKRTKRDVYIITPTLDSAVAVAVADCISQILEHDSRNRISILEITDLQGVGMEGSLCISLLDLGKPILPSISCTEYETLKKMVLQCHEILWITRDTRDQPFAGSSMGLLRTVRSERDSDGSNIVSLEVSELSKVSEEDLAIWSCAIVKHQFDTQETSDRHAEYMLRDNMIHIGRLHSFKSADKFLASLSASPPTEMMSIGDLQHSVRLENFGTAMKAPRWVIDPHHAEPLPDTHVQIEICAIGFSTNLNHLNMPIEGTGVVTKVGLTVRDLAPGHNVIFLTSETTDACFQTSIRIEETLVIKMTESVSLETPASLPIAFGTAIHALGHIAGLTSSDTILIHDGASPVGQAAIQYSNTIGARIFTTVSSVEERKLLAETYDIPGANMLSGQNTEFCKSIMRYTSGSGVDVIFNTLQGEIQKETLSCIAPFGRFIDASGKPFHPHATLAPESTLRTISISNLDVDLLIRNRPKIIRELIQDTLRLYSQGKISCTHPFKITGFSDIDFGIRDAQSRTDSTKIVFVPDATDKLPVVQEPLPPLQFDKDASYILAGGLGGLGRSIARWMAARGAKNLIFLSRSCKTTDAILDTISELRDLGCNVHIFACDILDRNRLGIVLKDCHSTLPPIRGCIQCSMVLQDGTFEGMSFDNWQTALRPKIEGSWNLHELLPLDLDFFLMLSSVAGIFGNRGQANYAAGNTFQDALAAYRTSRGMKASVIDLGSVSNVGWVAENRQNMTARTENLFELLQENEVHASIEYMIDPRHDKGLNHVDQPQSQLVLGLPTAEICRQNGIPAPSYLDYSLFTHQRATEVAIDNGTADEQKKISTAALLASTTTFGEAVTVVSDGIVEKLSALLAIPVSEIDVQRFGFGGIDSLVAMEFRSWTKKELNAEVSVLDIMGAQNIQSLSEKIVANRKVT